MGTPLAVLMVEDVEGDAALIVRELRRVGYDPTFVRVETPADFLINLAGGSWDVILSDYGLPSFNASMALELLQHSGLDIPFIIVSGTVGEETAVEAMRAGASDYLVKGHLMRLGQVIARELREKSSRAEQRTVAAALEKTEIRFRQLIEGLPDIVIVSVKGKIAYLNPMAVKALGYASNEDLLGHALLSIVHPDDREKSAERLASVLAGAIAPVLERRLLRRDGSVIHVQLSAQLAVLESEPAVVALARDMSEHRQTQNQLMVSERMASVGTLAAGVAHEINNPLASVLANLDFALAELGDFPQREALSPEVIRSLREAREAGERVRNIVRDLKIFSRSDDADRRGPVDVQLVLESSLRMAWNEIRHRARLVKDFGPVPRVLANDARLGQVFLNLIVNAAQAIPSGRAEKNEVRVVTRVIDGKVAIDVCDTGAGMPAAVLNRLFTPFFTTKPIGLGTGIGLSICHRIISDLGGEITVESEVGKGTTFRVLLTATNEIEGRRATAVPHPSRPGRRGRVLVVDDEAAIGRVIERTLRREHEVTCVLNGHDALKLISGGQRFDVILCDLMMPQMTGMELHARLCSAAPDQAELMIFVSGGTFTAEARSFLDQAPNPRMEKPFDAHQLRVIVNDRVLSAVT